jgi:thiamine monophosphate synthase
VRLALAPQGTARGGKRRAMPGDMPLVAIGGLTPEGARQALLSPARDGCSATGTRKHATRLKQPRA